MNILINELSSESDLFISAEVIRASYKNVAKEFNITEENCPSYAAFITHQRLKGMKAKGVRLFGLFLDNKQIGFVSTEKASSELFYIMKLAVLPEFRGRSFGKQLMEFAFEEIKKEGGKIISIAIVDNNQKRKDWYKELGFIEVKKENYPHLPFTICFMEKYL